MADWIKKITDPVMVESAWERHMSIGGINSFEAKKYTASGSRQSMSETASGQKHIRKSVVKLSEAIEKAQRLLLATGKRDREDRATVIVVPPDTSALIAMKLVLDRTYTAKAPTIGVMYQNLAKEVAKALETEANFRNWLLSSKENAKEYAKAQGMDSVPPSIAERLMKEQSIDSRTMRRWRQTFEELKNYKWSDEALHYCGDTILTVLVNTLPDQFEAYVRNTPLGSVKMVRMTPEFRESLGKTENIIASSQVMKKPMLTRPKSWNQ